MYERTTDMERTTKGAKGYVKLEWQTNPCQSTYLYNVAKYATLNKHIILFHFCKNAYKQVLDYL